ncbi:LuxR family transcriptional regulator [Microbacterium paludicola]|uniref:helix-turn-helix transcriptional regulator n=1 Tax=Microbacterium paludicola TaxID=300019 RepID=UPI00119FFA15|nr:LuxR family transcriptional regulator [Microbacterium paludicola]
MTDPTSAIWLKRPRLEEALSSPARVVILVGPIGSGSTTLLRQWARGHENVTWGWSRAIPDASGGVLLFDEADELDEADWQRIRDMRRTQPQLLVRGSVRSTHAVPAGEDVEFVRDLSFTKLETSEYLASLGSQLDPSAVYRATGGLPAAVDALARLKSTRPTLVRETLALLRPGSLDARDARLAVPEVLTAELITELGGEQDFLARAEAAGQGEWMADAGHPLFLLTAPVRAATLKSRPVDDAQPLREAAGRVLLSQGAWLGALIEGVGAGSLDVVDSALRGGGMLLLTTHGATISALLQEVNVWELRRWPVIAMALALIYNARHEHRVRAMELMGVALIAARSAPAGSSERALLRLLESVLQRLLGIGDGGVKAARTAVRVVGELPAADRRAMVGLLGDIHIHAAISLMYGGHGPEALGEFAHARAAAGRPGVQLISLGGTAAIHALSGDLVTAQGWVDTTLTRPWPTRILDEYQGALLHIARAKIHLEHDELDDADASLDRVWHIIDTIEHWPLLAHLRAQVDICRGRPREGLERFWALRRRRGTRISRPQARLLDLTESSLTLSFGDVAAAVLIARPGDLPSVSVGVARSEMFAGQYARALRTLARISPDGPGVRASVAALEAVCLRRLEYPDDAGAAARRARAVADAHGLRTPFLLIPAEDRHLFGDIVPWDPPAGGVEIQTPRLTEREHVVLRALVDTTSVNDIAERLHVSTNTVKSQRRSLYRKLGANSREQALAVAIGRGLLDNSR